MSGIVIGWEPERRPRRAILMQKRSARVLEVDDRVSVADSEQC